MPDRWARRAVVLVGLGMCLIQTAWILALPPYRGIDEFDHAYRANSVAQGYWRTWETPENGRGELIPVRRSIVEDGMEVCRSYAYTGPDNCRPVEALGGGNVTVASAAARYNPVPYSVLGLPSLFTEGSAAVYAMRWFNAGLCALIVGSAAWIAGRFRTPWPLTGLVLGLSPVLVYSTAIVAPNGLELAASLALWLAMLALPVIKCRPTLVLILAASAMIVAGTRPLGPLWTVLILAISILATEPRLRWRTLAVRPWVSSSVLALVGLTLVANCVWLLSSRTYEIDRFDRSDLNRWTTSLSEIPLWMLQSIAAFPTRTEPAPTVVYPLVLVPFVSLIALAFMKSSRTTRVVLTVTALTAIAVPFAFTAATVTQHGTVWQGRYGLPLSVGIVLMAAVGLDRASIPFMRRPVLVLGIVSLAAAQSVSVVSVLLNEMEKSPLVGDGRWMMLPPAVPAVLAAVGTALMIVPCLTVPQSSSTRGSLARPQETSV